jgi:hypothetical protein
MADVKISGLPASTVPLAGTEVLPIVQSSTTKKVSIANVTAGRAVSALSFAPTGSALPVNGVFLPAANAVGLSTDSEERLRVFATGGVSIGNTTDPGATNLSITGTGKFGTTVGIGAATPAATGAGITFPATQSASTDVNTLDDYEEGTWTPTTVIAGATYTAQTGTYTKIGRQVTVLGFLAWSAHTGAGGNLVIGGLPFAASSTALYMPGFVTVATTLPTGRNTIVCYILPSASSITVIGHDSTAALADSEVRIAATGSTTITYTYFV